MAKKISLIFSLILIFSLSTANAQINSNETPNENMADTEMNAGTNTSGEQVQEGQTNAPSETQEEAETFSLWRVFKQGGPFMWPILILTALGLAFVIERFIAYARARLASKEFVDQIERSIVEKDLGTIEELCSTKNNKLAGIIQKGLTLKHLGYERVEKTLSVAASVEVAGLERNLSIISAVANIVPMLGFLGTVTGMVTAFNDIAAADQVSAKIVAGGIKEALLTTASGLIAAIPLLLFYNYFVNRIEGFITSVERISSDIIEKLIKGKSSIGTASIPAQEEQQ